MSRTPFSSRRPSGRGTYRPQLEALESRLAPGSLLGVEEPPLIGFNREADEVAALAAVAAGHDRVRTTSPVVDFADASIVRGTSTLTRTDDQVSIHLKTSGLVAGGAYTAWWVVFETPGATPKAGWATGFVARPNGKLNLKEDLNEGETLERHPDFSGRHCKMRCARRSALSSASTGRLRPTRRGSSSRRRRLSRTTPWTCSERFTCLRQRRKRL